MDLPFVNDLAAAAAGAGEDVAVPADHLLPLLVLSLQRLQAREQQQQQGTTLGLSANALKILAAILLLAKLAHSYVSSSVSPGSSSSSNSSSNGSSKPKRVAVIGGGIAGAGAAYALRRAGMDAVIFEKKPKLGGNAKSFTWKTDDNKNDKGVETGLAVLAYPDKYFHSYCALMKQLGMQEGHDHELKYLVAERNYRRQPGDSPDKQEGGLEVVYAHHTDFQPDAWLVRDLAKWEWMIQLIRRINAWFAPCDYPSLYRMSVLNPLNLVSLKRMSWLCGLSDLFWERVFVPVHTSTFLEVEMGDVPAVMGELLADLVPLSTPSTSPPKMKAWPGTAYDVFAQMQQEWPAHAVRTSCEVDKLCFVQSTGEIQLFHEDTQDDLPELFDAVIFACPATSAQRILSKSEGGRSNSFLKWLEDYLLRHTQYTVDRDEVFQKGVVHSDADAVFPSKLKQQLLNEHCNYMEIDGQGKQNSSLENHFIISSWAPTAQATKHELPMLVSYLNSKDNNGKLNKINKAEWTVTSRDAHPCLTMWQSSTSVTLWPLLQGFRNRSVYYCGSAFTPGNGHDLSLLSGFVAASELGAPYPLPDCKEGVADFQRLRGMMLGMWA